MPATDWGWLISPEEFRSWILHDGDGLLVVNKPGYVVCHPSKHGPWSSLIGAAREYLGVERLHMPYRLDRETSGVVVFASNLEIAALLHQAVEAKRFRKTYYALLCGELRQPVVVDQRIGKDRNSRVSVRRTVVEAPEGQSASTEFVPIEVRNGHTLVRVHPATGRLHQIRVHAAWLGHPVVGDKLYGPDESLFLEFIEHGFTPRLEQGLHLPRQALHAAEVLFEGDISFRFVAPLSCEIYDFFSRL